MYGTTYCPHLPYALECSLLLLLIAFERLLSSVTNTNLTDHCPTRQMLWLLIALLSPLVKSGHPIKLLQWLHHKVNVQDLVQGQWLYLHLTVYDCNIESL